MQIELVWLSEEEMKEFTELAEITEAGQVLLTLEDGRRLLFSVSGWGTVDMAAAIKEP